MIPVLSLAAITVITLIVAYSMVDGRNRIIQFLRENLDASSKSLDKAKLAFDAVRIEKDRERKTLTERLTARDERITKIVNSLSSLQWDRERGDRYRLTISFDPRMVWYGAGEHMDREIIARELSQQVFHDIVSSKFVESAAERQRQHEMKSRRPYAG